MYLDFTKTLCYIIQREIDVVSHTEYNFKSLAKNGLFGRYFYQLICVGAEVSLSSSDKEHKLAREHIIIIELDLAL